MRLRITAALMMMGIAALATGGYAQQQAYIEQYKNVAIHEMREYGIPASITLAQGILESASGTSYLATKANNHFGIKCHQDWGGKKVYRDDDKKNECFRKYEHAEESFRDHSEFLKNRSRYAFLFKEEITDYKAWAYGLKQAGYATNPKYPKLLIKIIEDHELYKYDKMEGAPEVQLDKVLGSHVVLISPNDVEYIEVLEGDSFESIATKTETSVKRILKYNELNYDAQLVPGQKLYLQPKRKKANDKTYTVLEGDDMYSISQKFAIKLKYLYKRNDMKIGEQPKPGQVLELR